MGCCFGKANKNIIVPETSVNFRSKHPPPPKFILYDPQNVIVNLTEEDEELYSPTPPKNDRDQLIPDLAVFNRIDQHAKTAPAICRSSAHDLANYLIEPCKTDIDIVRAFYIWVCHNISYDVDSYFGNTTQRSNDAKTVLTTGLAVCEGYSNIFASLCRAVGIPVKKVSGYAKGYGHDAETPFVIGQKTNHAWNAIFVQGEWRLVETTWGAGNMSNNQFHREVTDVYFLMDPSLMVNAHYPFMNNNEARSHKWQLLQKPQSLDQFNTSIKKYGSGLEWEVDITPDLSVIKVSRKTEIIIQSKRLTLVKVMAVLQERNSNTQIDGFLFVHQISKGKFVVSVQPPFKGKYKLSLFGNISNEENQLPGIAHIILDVTDVDENVNPYPNVNMSYGANDPKAHGLAESMRCGGLYVSKTGTIGIPVETEPGVSLTTELIHSLKEIKDSRDYSSLERKSKTKYICQVRLPYCGFYEFKIFTRLPNQSGSTLPFAARVLIECLNPTNKGPFPTTYDFAKEIQCTMIQPDSKAIAAESSVVFEVCSSQLVVATVHTNAGKFSMTPVKDSSIWKCTVQTPRKGEEITLYGNITSGSGSLKGLYKFVTV
ncbi:hypothetical protein SNE40_000966 [Patella caerulea]|uniref:Transglutaminase-like domain-containing protein n=1 Tax=Patella caerulea TaxID=87958 RepID=A0AAN8KEZ0_PATCE